MLRTVLSTLVVLSISAVTTVAVSNPAITGNIAGVELCPQSICGSAVFAGNFIGRIGPRPARGVFWAAITHDDLPLLGNASAITGGTWLIRVPGRVFSGTVAAGGVITNNGDDTFTVNLTMQVASGGTGEMTFAGLLDHNPFPPTIVGSISQ